MAVQEFTFDLHESIHGFAHVTEDHFGQIYTTFQTFGQFQDASADMHSGHIRWPGGSLAENKGGQDQYHLLNPELHSHNVPEKGFSNILENAGELDLNVSMVLPTRPYFLEGSTDSYSDDLNVFFDRLTHEDGFYDEAQDFLDGPSELMLEIGNETWQLGYGDWSYGNLAYEALQTASEHSEVSETDNIKFAVQTGSYHDDNGLFSTKLIINNLDGATSNRTGGSDFAEQENVLDQIDSLVNHDGLVAQAKDFDFEEERAVLEEWKSAMGEHWDNVDLYASAWSVGYHAEGYSELESASPEKLAEIDIGARQGAGTLDVFAKLTALGYDSAALWGVADPNLNSNSYLSQNADGEESYNWSDSGLSHGGEVLRLLAESTSGMDLLSGNVDQSTGEWNTTYYDWETKEGADALNTYGFVDDTKFVLFASVTDLDGDRYSYEGDDENASMTHTFDVSDLHAVEFVTVEAIRTEFDLDAWREFKEEHPELKGNDLRAYRRLFERPETHTETIQVQDDGTFEYEFSDDFEVVRFVGDTTLAPKLAETGEEPVLEPNILFVEAVEGGTATVESNEISFHPEKGFTGPARIMFVTEDEENNFQTSEINVIVNDDQTVIIDPQNSEQWSAESETPNVLDDTNNDETAVGSEDQDGQSSTEAAQDANVGEEPEEGSHIVVNDFVLGRDTLEIEDMAFGTDPGQLNPQEFLAEFGSIDGGDLVISFDDDSSLRLTGVADEDDMLQTPESLANVLLPNPASCANDADILDHNAPDLLDDASPETDLGGLDLGDGREIKFLDPQESDFYQLVDFEDDDEDDDPFEDAFAALGFLF